MSTGFVAFVSTSTASVLLVCPQPWQNASYWGSGLWKPGSRGGRRPVPYPSSPRSRCREVEAPVGREGLEAPELLDHLLLGRGRCAIAGDGLGVRLQSGAVVRIHGLAQSLGEQRPLIRRGGDECADRVNGLGPIQGGSGSGDCQRVGVQTIEEGRELGDRLIRCPAQGNPAWPCWDSI